MLSFDTPLGGDPFVSLGPSGVGRANAYGNGGFGITH